MSEDLKTDNAARTAAMVVSTQDKTSNLMIDPKAAAFNMQAKSYFIFDLDDTLIRTGDSKEAGLKAAYGRLQSLCMGNLEERLPYDAFRKGIVEMYEKRRLREENESGDPITFDFIPEIFEDYCAGLELAGIYTHSHINALAARVYWSFKEARYAVLAPYPQAYELLRHLESKGKTLICLTQGTCNHQHTKLMICELDGIFDHIYVVRNKKKELKQNLEKMGIDPKDAILMGDKPDDVEAAKHAGVHSIRVCQGPHGDKKPETCGDLKLRSLNELLSITKEQVK